MICTYNNLAERMRQYHMIVAVKKDIDKIQRGKAPQRDDEYGTSILNIQIAKNGSHMSIKNRYNHTVNECDSTLNNNLDMLVLGLQAKVLGYYNIASLNNNKCYYNRIVNINGIYLKYNREVNNVYFGDFVLDNENGARFTDHSKYYAKVNDDYWNEPYVLDFQKKEVIQLFDVRYQNSKSALLIRAMKENLLNSDNKEEADNLNIIFPDATKELLQCRKKALQYVANNYGYDFQKPFKVTGLLGKFTAKSIEKATVSNCGILLICKGSNVKCVRLNKGKFDIGVRQGYEYIIDYYCSKEVFETDRKSGKLGIFVIQQDDEYKRVVKNTFTNSYYSNRDEFDKSGCNITKTRQRLHSRLCAYKADKRKREVDAISYENELKNIKEMFSRLKSELILKLSEAKTEDEYKKLRNVFDYKYVWIVRHIKTLENKVIQNGFYSIEEATNSITILKETITDKIKKIEG